MTDEAIIRSFPRYQGPGSPGFVTDFLGTRTRTSYISSLAPEGGVVEDYPIPTNFHASAMEWAGALRAVLDAAEAPELVAVELGAGWGPWLVATARAAQMKGIGRVRLVGVEGSEQHCAYMASHFADNGLDPAEHALMHGIVGTADGVAEFPVLADPSEEWGASAVFSARSGLSLWRAARLAGRTARRVLRLATGSGGEAQRVERVPCFSLPTILRPFERVDIVHVDIQGDEFDVVKSAREVLKEKVKRLVIGTHARSIERRLSGELRAQGWVLEAEEPCEYRRQGWRSLLSRDGCQVWRNRAFDGERAAWSRG